MMRFRLLSLGISAVVCSIVVYAAATHRISGITDLWDDINAIQIVKEDKPKPPPPPPPKTPPPPPPPVVMRETKVDLPVQLPPVVTEIPVAKAPPPAPPAPPAPPQITPADFGRKPDGAAYARYYPSRALEREKDGSVSLRCSVAASGRLTSCAVVNEDPPSWGFGEASVKMAQREFQVNPRTVNGQPSEGGVITFTIRWKLG